MKHHSLRMLGALYCALSLFACTTINTDCPGAEPRATHTPKKHFALGYKPDEKFPVGVVKAFTASPWAKVKALQSVDLRAQLPPDDDQGAVGRCTGFGLAHAMYAALYKANVKDVFFSPNFIYYNERVNMGTVTQDSGARIGADGIFTLKKSGSCLIKTWPTCKDFTQRPSAAAYTEGKKHLVITAYNVDNRNGDELERAMSAGFVIVYGIILHSSFEYLSPSNYIYTGQGNIIGGHCMVAFKYDKGTGRIRTRNQWGANNWGASDEFEMPLSLMHGSEVSDCYVIYAVMK